MALLKTIDTAYGACTSYHRITRINENFDGATEVFVSSYIDELSRQNRCSALENRSFVFDLRDASRSDVYARLSEEEIFANAESV